MDGKIAARFVGNNHQPIGTALDIAEGRMKIEVIFRGAGRSLPDAAKAALLDKHYLQRLPPISHSFVGWSGDRIVSVVTFGVPASRHLQKSLCPESPDLVLELNRLWIDDDMRGTRHRLSYPKSSQCCRPG
jgi:hypothetical protein